MTHCAFGCLFSLQQTTNDHPARTQLGQTHEIATQDEYRNQSRRFNSLIGYDNVHMELIYWQSDVTNIG